MPPSRGLVPSVNGKIGIPFISLMDPLERGGAFIRERKGRNGGSASYVSNARNGGKRSAKKVLEQEE